MQADHEFADIYLSLFTNFFAYISFNDSYFHNFIKSYLPTAEGAATPTEASFVDTSLSVVFVSRCTFSPKTSPNLVKLRLTRWAKALPNKEASFCEKVQTKLQ